ncbi:hypothetical protein EX30DRAFT_115122 [Ascodesmis nigricans]|uniref:Uncharacterized protein n=1 Tax=Ascodesmis nigricans TaxID=341454 RepID=A0A4S2MPZ5_9PEZI|nr:hypothetical protein EX30DRAFT_115122 [Ascodesmis nigricans]
MYHHPPHFPTHHVDNTPRRSCWLLITYRAVVMRVYQRRCCCGPEKMKVLAMTESRWVPSRFQPRKRYEEVSLKKGSRFGRVVRSDRESSSTWDVGGHVTAASLPDSSLVSSVLGYVESRRRRMRFSG